MTIFNYLLGTKRLAYLFTRLQHIILLCIKAFQVDVELMRLQQFFLLPEFCNRRRQNKRTMNSFSVPRSGAHRSSWFLGCCIILMPAFNVILPCLCQYHTPMQYKIDINKARVTPYTEHYSRYQTLGLMVMNHLHYYYLRREQSA